MTETKETWENPLREYLLKDTYSLRAIPLSSFFDDFEVRDKVMSILCEDYQWENLDEALIHVSVFRSIIDDLSFRGDEERYFYRYPFAALRALGDEELYVDLLG